MGHASRKKRKAHKRGPMAAVEQASTAPVVLPKRSWSRAKLIGAFTGGITLIGLISGLLSLQPKFNVSTGEPITPDDLESLPIEFVNDSPYAVDWIRHVCVIHAARLKDGTVVENLESFPIAHRQQRISTSEGRIVFCVITGKDGTKVEAADIGLRVLYKPWFLPIERSAEYRFDVFTDSSGKLRGLRRPTSDYTLAP